MSLADLKDVVTIITALVASYVAVRGLNTWNRQLRGSADFDVARKLARATYKLRDEIMQCRSPLIRGFEFPEGYGQLRQRTPQEEAEAYAHVYDARWKPVAAAAQEFDTAVLEAEALWGTDLRTAADKLQACLRDLYASFESIVDDKRAGGQHFASDRDFGVKMRATAAATMSSNDVLSQEVRSAITGIEDKLRPHLKRV
jgi:hypothetical protein